MVKTFGVIPYSFEAIPEVVVDNEGGYKFIVVELSDASGRKRLVVRGEQTRRHHRRVFSLFSRIEGWFENGIVRKPLGGGKIRVSQAEKIVRIWGKSHRYGLELNRDLTVELLRKAFPDFQISTQVPKH